MQMNIYVDAKLTDDQRRAALYAGSIFVHSPSEYALKLCGLALELIEEAFHPNNPLHAYEQIPAEKCAELLAVLKPKFIHHPKSKEYIQGMLASSGCDLEKTYFDVPRMRTAFPGDYLNSGIAYAFHPHRDTWYSAPMCQINWWMPIYELNSENCMALHPNYFSRGIKNGSNQYNYQRWNQESRFNAAQHVKTDTRVQPHAEEPIELEPQIRMICPVAGAYQFSAAQLHSTAPNTSPVTRFSIDFRTVHLDDLVSQGGAVNLDSACTGTTIGDYLRGSDLAHIPDEIVAPYLDSANSSATSAVAAGQRS
jgi:hypothetical protein